MKKLLIFVFYLIFLDSVQAQNQPQKVWQVMFDWNGYRDDVRSIMIDQEGKYIVSGIKRPIEYNPKTALARIDTNGRILWKWVSNEDTCWTTIVGISPWVWENNAFIFVQLSRRPPKAIIFSLAGEILGYYTFFPTTSNSICLITENHDVYIVEEIINGKCYILHGLDSVKKDFIVDLYEIQNIKITSTRIGFFGTNYSTGGNWNMAGFARVFDKEGNLIFQRKQQDVSRAAGTIDENGYVYLSYTEPVGTEYITAKFDSFGNEMWKKYWSGYPKNPTNQVAWVMSVIPYPTGGCLSVGSIGKDTFGLPISANLRDFGVVAYNSNGEELWYIRDEAGYRWELNDLWAAAWDKEGYLVLAGSSAQQWDGKCYIVVQKWFVPGVTSVEDKPNPNPEDYKLFQNYPNPFNSTTTIRFTIPHRSNVTLKVFDILGKEVATLVNEEKDPGNYEVKFDASNLPTGVYFYRIKADEFTQTKKMVLMK